MSKRYTEGKLSSIVLTENNDEIDFDALGVIADFDDFMSKLDRIPKEVHAPPGSLRAQKVANIQHWTKHVRRFLATPQAQSPIAKSALLHLMHISMSYVSLLHELADDTPSRKADLTRGEYLEFRAKAKSRKQLAEFCGMSPQALQKWEDANGMPRPRRK